jgi:ribonuclease HI
MEIYTDGGCSGNPGPGGWAFVIIEFSGGNSRIIAEQWGAEPVTTNNRMELLAVISALDHLCGLYKQATETPAEPLPKQLLLYTDSQYVQKGISEWIHTWKRNNWRTKDKKPVKNQDLWLRLDEAAARCTPQWKWVRGHAGNTYNERCDELTQTAIASLKRKDTTG